MAVLPEVERRGLIQRATRAERLLMGCVAFGMLAAVLLGHWLQPDPRGFGTHEQLGFPPCTFQRYLGVPCPFCGMTTAFSLMAHARPREAVHVQPAGAFAFACAAALAAMLLALACAGRKVPLENRPVVLRSMVTLGLIIVAAAWVYTLTTAFHQGR
jgi:hypothetical protein